MQHWHVMDHYSLADRIYLEHQRSLMRQWVRRHGGEPIVEVVACDEPRCLALPMDGRHGEGE